MENLISDKTHLERLQKILKYEIHFVIFSVLLIMYPSLGMKILNLIMILLIPYIAFVLYRIKKYSWIVFLVSIVVLPMLNWLLEIFGSGFEALIDYLPLFFFLLYTFSLKWVIRDWLDDLNAKIFRKYKTYLPK